MKPLNLKIYNNHDLVPEAWKQSRGAVPEGVGSDWYVFNPTLIGLGDEYVMTYRVVDEVYKTRRIASCKLDRALAVVPGSITPLSDLIEFDADAGFTERTLTWHADPRYFRLGGELYVFWNDGSLKPANHQFMQKIGPDGLQPVGRARLVRKDPHESRIEKNWQFFDAQDAVYAIYENRPLHLLAVDMAGAGTLHCREAVQQEWSAAYEESYGHIRGGAQPVLHNGSFLTLAHSSCKNSKRKLDYYPCFYRFEAQHPFRVTHRPVGPFSIPVPDLTTRHLPPLNKQTATVVYPCGLVVEGEQAVISFGVNDESCAVGVFRVADIEATLESVDAPPARPKRKKTAESAEADGKAPRRSAIPLFWWNSKGKRFDPFEGGRHFDTGNVGDIAARLFVEQLSGTSCRAPKKGEPKLLSIGSILQNAANGDIVWGSGIKGSAEGFKNPVEHLSVHAVRGPLTVDFLRRQGIATPDLKALFDPGCLIPVLYADELRNTAPNPRKLCVIPHYRDDAILRQRHPELAHTFLSVDALPLDFVKGLLGAELVVSSSLHGIIFAEALGIPALWLAPLNGEDELKYYDYYYGTDRFRVKRFTSVEDALRAEPMALPKFSFDDYLKSFPEDLRSAAAMPVLAAAEAPPLDAVAQEIRPVAAREVAAKPQDVPSLMLMDAISELRLGSYAAGAQKLKQVFDLGRDEAPEQSGVIAEKAAALYLGCADFGAIVDRLGFGGTPANPQDFLFRLLVETLHAERPQTEEERTLDLVKVLGVSESISDGQGSGRSSRWRILEAYVNFCLARYDRELILLRTELLSDGGSFWSTVQSVYRFRRTLPELTSLLTELRPGLSNERDVADHHVVYFPKYRNAYQPLLYRSLHHAGGTAISARSVQDLLSREPVSGAENVLHLHWIDPVLNEVLSDAQGASRRVAEFMDGLSRRKSAGFKLYWTIHNYLSHECLDKEAELALRRELYRLADKVFIHHPLAADLLDWLPDLKKVCVVEHGHYDLSVAERVSRASAREQLGFEPDDFIVTHIGQIRDYKGLVASLPVLHAQLEETPRMKLVVAGKVKSSGVKDWLRAHAHPRLIVRSDYLSDEDLSLHMRAADIGFLSYDEILTSGSLVHWLSSGRPVLAPEKGIIPAYVVDGWNGVVYRDQDGLRRVLKRLSDLPKADFSRIENNALSTAASMEWRLWQPVS